MKRRKRCRRKDAALVLWLLLVACGGETDSLPNPTPSDPWFGQVGNVLISDRGRSTDAGIDQLWIGFNSQAAWQDFMGLNQKFPEGGFWIGGRVVALASHPMGFYFDPSTAFVAEITVEAIQTTIDQIKADPNEFAKNPLGVWVVSASVERILSAGP